MAQELGHMDVSFAPEGNDEKLTAKDPDTLVNLESQEEHVVLDLVNLINNAKTDEELAAAQEQVEAYLAAREN